MYATIAANCLVAAVFATTLLGPSHCFAEKDTLPIVLDFELGEGSPLPVITGTIASRPVRCIVDTGASFSVLERAFERHTGELKRKTRLNGESVDLLDGPQMAVAGGSSLKLDEVAILELSLFETEFKKKVHGIVGMDVLSAYAVEFDFDRNKLILHPQGFSPSWKDCDCELQFSVARRPCVVVAFNNDQAWTLVDSGNTGNGTVAAQLFDSGVEDGSVLRLADSKISTLAQSDRVSTRGRINSVTLDKYSHDSIVFTRYEYCSLGIKFLSRYQVLLDVSAGKCYLKQRRKLIDRP